MFILVLCKMMLSQDSFKHEKKGRSTSKLIAILVFFKMPFVLEPNSAFMDSTVWGGESAWWPVLPQDHMAIRHFWEYAHLPGGGTPPVPLMRHRKLQVWSQPQIADSEEVS